MKTIKGGGKKYQKINRFETKFVISTKQISDIEKIINRYMRRDTHNRGQQCTIESLYFDTHNFDFYREKKTGLPKRRKLRVRRYNSDQPFDEKSPVYLEIKKKIAGRTKKRRMKMRLYKSLQYCQDKNKITDSEHRRYSFFREFKEVLSTYQVHPQIVTVYDREAWVGKEDGEKLRITFDTHVGYRRQDLKMGKLKREKFIIPKSQAIMEIKVNKETPEWLEEVITQNKLKPVHISKYSRGLEMSGSAPQINN